MDKKSEPDAFSKPRRDWKPLFLKVLAETDNVSFAAEVAGIERSYTYKTYRKDAEFRKAWKQAEEDATYNVIVPEMLKRALVGEPEFILFQGQMIWVWVDRDGNPLPPGVDPSPGCRQVPLRKYHKSNQILLTLFHTHNPAAKRASARRNKNKAAMIKQSINIQGQGQTPELTVDEFDWSKVPPQVVQALIESQKKPLEIEVKDAKSQEAN